MPRLQFLNKTKNNKHITGVLVVLIVAIAGTVLIILTHAAGPYASKTADTGTLAGSASKQVCSGADDGNCVVFGSQATNGSNTINLTPDGPPPPAGGWSVIFGDAFNVPFTQDKFWQAINRAALNGNELETFNTSQVTQDSSGLELTMKYVPGSGLVSGFAETNGSPNDFWWENNQSGSFVFEIVTRFPINTGETDLGFWGDNTPYTPHGTETDFFETGGWGSYNSTNSNWTDAALYMAVPDGGLSGSVYGALQPINPSAGFHRYTILVQAKKMSMWIDGNPVSGLQNIGPGKQVTTQLPIWLSYAARTPQGHASGFTSGQRTWTVRSVAVYRDKSDLGIGYKNGGLAPGTAVK